MVTQGQTNLFTKSLKYFYYICGIKFQNNGSNVQYAVNNFSRPTLSTPTEPDFEMGKTTLNMAQKGILDTKIKKFVDREEIKEENLKRAFTILHGNCTERLLSKLGGDRKYEDIKSYQDVIEMLNLIKGVMFKFDVNKELTHAMC